MNPEIKAKWVAALRSGEYKQGRDVLRTEDDAYCCLGVLCDLAAREGVGEWDPSYGHFVSGVADIGYALPPTGVVEWAGLGGVCPYVEVDGDHPALSSLNDTGRTFGEIADLIEAQL